LPQYWYSRTWAAEKSGWTQFVVMQTWTPPKLGLITETGQILEEIASAKGRETSIQASIALEVGLRKSRPREK
jgi:hypothetical protein